VHLDGEIVAGVQHLDEDGEPRVVEETGAENLSIDIPKSMSAIETSLRLPGNKNPQ
jgi:hypothetical protein